MKSILFLTICFLLNSIFIDAQQNTLYKSKIQSTVSYGRNVSLTKFNKNTTSDYLLLYDENTHFFQLINIGFFPFKHVGFEINYRINQSQKTRTLSSTFKKEVEEKYSNDYFYKLNSNLEDGLYNTGYLGIIYRYEIRKFNFQSKISFGSTGFVTKSTSIYLKEKSSNKYHEINYSPNTSDYNFFTTGLGFSVGYKLHKKLIPTFEMNYSTFKPNIVIQKEVKDLLLNTSKTEEYKYNNRQHNLSFGIGITYVFKNKK